MSLDTTSKRRSSCQILQPWQLTPPNPDSVLSDADRRHIAGTYSGITTNTIGLLPLTGILGFAASLVKLVCKKRSNTLSSLGSYTIGSIGVVEKDVTTNISISDEAVGRFSVKEVDVKHDLHINEIIIGYNPLQNISDSNNLIIVEKLGIVLPEQTIQQSIVFTEIVDGSFGLNDTIDSSQIIDYNVGKGLKHDLNIIESVIAIGIRTLPISHSLIIHESIIAYVDKFINSLCSYDDSPSYSKQSTITLTYPYVSPSLSVILRTPQLDNSERFSYNRIIRESRGGTQLVYRKSTWPKNKRLTYEITFNKNTEIENFFNFAVLCVGQEIGLLDYLNRQWKGILIIADEVFTDAGRFDRRLNFDFEGELV